MRWFCRAGLLLALASGFVVTSLYMSARDHQQTVDLIAYDAWLVADTEAAREPGAAELYLTIENHSDHAVTLTSIEAQDDGIAIVIEDEGEPLDIGPNSALRFAPDAVHAQARPEGDMTLPEPGLLLELTFAAAGERALSLEVAALLTSEAPENTSGMIAYGGWARPTALEAGGEAVPGVISGAYLTLENRDNEADTLVAATSPRAGVIELHETRMDNGIARMRPVEVIELEPNAQVHLEPGGLHFMLIDLPQHLVPGEVVPLTLAFESGQEVAVGIPVRDERTDQESHSH